MTTEDTGSVTRAELSTLLDALDKHYTALFAAHDIAVIGLEKLMSTGFVSRDKAIDTAVAAFADKLATVNVLQTRWSDTMVAQIDASFVDLEKRVDVGFASAEKQAVIVSGTLEKRLDMMNEFRLALTDQTNTFVPRAELDKHFHDIEETCRALVVASERITVTGLQASKDARDALEKSMLAKFESMHASILSGFEARDKSNAAAMQSSREAVQKAEFANEKRLDSVNEFRKTLSDQTSSFIPRLEVDQRFQAVDKAIDQLSKQQSRDDGRSIGLNAGWGYLAGGLGIIVAVLSLIITFFRH